ncbi:hypothetical protein JTB14_011460 [Gonioctena quinquepunctata]|nr:hypothetical protein JTB14_011460 [Gonioctena quinquepunctata]
MSESDLMETTLKNLSSKREKFQFFNTLSCLVKSMEGLHTLIDLRNENAVSGKIVKVDGWMNVEMEDVVFYDSRGDEHVFPQFFITKRNLRYVHIPKGFSAVELMKNQITEMTCGRSITKKKPHTLKLVRAKRYQKAIVESAFSQEPSTSK